FTTGVAEPDDGLVAFGVAGQHVVIAEHASIPLLGWTALVRIMTQTWRFVQVCARRIRLADRGGKVAAPSEKSLLGRGRRLSASNSFDGLEESYETKRLGENPVRQATLRWAEGVRD